MFMESLMRAELVTLKQSELQRLTAEGEYIREPELPT